MDSWVEPMSYRPNRPGRPENILRSTSAPSRPLSGVVSDPLSIRGNLDTKDKVTMLVQTAAVLAVAYHGYRRNKESLPWAASWAVGGLLCPTVTLAFALSQGFAKTAR